MSCQIVAAAELRGWERSPKRTVERARSPGTPKGPRRLQLATHSLEPVSFECKSWMRDMPAVLVMVILSGLTLGTVGADYFKFRAVLEPASETPAQQSARASRKWCPPNSSEKALERPLPGDAGS